MYSILNIVNINVSTYIYIYIYEFNIFSVIILNIIVILIQHTVNTLLNISLINNNIDSLFHNR